MKRYNAITWNQASRMANDLRDFLFLASTPNEETCTPAGGSLELQLLECNAYIGQLIRENGQPPADANFFITENHHEFGTYFEAGIWYTPTQPEQEGYSESEEYAMKCEIGPERWDNAALAELRKAGHPSYTAKIIQLRKTA